MFSLQNHGIYSFLSHFFLYSWSIVLFLMVGVEGGSSPHASLKCYFARDYYATPLKAAISSKVEALNTRINPTSEFFLNVSPLKKEYDAQSGNSVKKGCYTGRGVHVALLDTGLDPGFLAASRNAVSCSSFIPNVSCTDAGFEHGTRSASVLAGNVCLGRRGSMQRNSSLEGLTTCDLLARPSSSLAARMTSAGEKQSELLKSEGPCYFGMAPDAQLHMMRIFDKDGQTHPRYILLALRALRKEVEQHTQRSVVLCLCFARNYFQRDGDIAREIRLLAAAGVVILAAAGNEGALFGGVMSPSDLPEVLTVGSVTRKPFQCNSAKDATEENAETRAGRQQTRGPGMVSAFSSRGPTTVELPSGAGRVKPEVVAVGERVCTLEAVQVVQRSGEFSSSAGSAPKKEEIKPKAHVAVDHNVAGGTPLGDERELWARSWSLVSHRSGTSISASLTAGIAALCIEALQQQSSLVHPPQASLLRPNIALIKEILIKTARRLIPPVSDEKKGAWYFATQRNGKSNAQPARRGVSRGNPAAASAHNAPKEHDPTGSPPLPEGNETHSTAIYAGDALLRTYTHYLYLLQYSMLGQGAGEIQPDRALALIEAQAPQILREYNGTRLGTERWSGAALRQSSSNLFAVDNKFTRPGWPTSNASDDAALVGWVVFPPRLDARVHPATQIRSSKSSGGEATHATDCLYHWPYCEQPLYLGAAPRVFNLTLHIAACANAVRQQRHHSGKKTRAEVDACLARNGTDSEALARCGWSYTIDHVIGHKSKNAPIGKPFDCKCGKDEGKTDAYESVTLNHSALGSLFSAIPTLDLQVYGTNELRAHTGTISITTQVFLPNCSKCHHNESDCGSSGIAPKEDFTILGMRGKQTNTSTFASPYEQIDMYGTIVLAYACSNDPGELPVKTWRTPFTIYVTVPFAFSIRTRAPPRLQRVSIDTSHQWLNPFDYSPSSALSKKGFFYTTARGASHAAQAVVRGLPRDLQPPPHAREAQSPGRERPNPSVNHPHANLALFYLFLTRELGFYVDFFPVLMPPLPTSPNTWGEVGFKPKKTAADDKAMDWLSDYLASVGTLLVVHQWLPLLPAVRHRLTSAIRPTAPLAGDPSGSLRKGLNVVLITDWSNPAAAARLFQPGSKQDLEDKQEKTTEEASSFSATSWNCASVCEAMVNKLSVFSKLCCIALSPKFCYRNFSNQRFFHAFKSSSPSPSERWVHYRSLRNFHVLSINRWLKELIYGDKTQSIPCSAEENHNATPRVVLPQLSEDDGFNGLWMLPLNSHPSIPRRGAEKDSKGWSNDHATAQWRSIGGFYAGWALLLMEQPIARNEPPTQLMTFSQQTPYDLLLCGSHDPWKASQSRKSSNEAFYNFSSRGVVGLLSFPPAFPAGSAGQVAVMVDSSCLAASGRKTQQLFMELLRVYIAHHVVFAENLHDGGFSFFNFQNGLIRRLHQSEGIQGTTCMELAKELLYAVLAKNWAWFSASREDSNGSDKADPVGEQSGAASPPCTVSVGAFGRTFPGNEPPDKITQENNTVDKGPFLSSRCATSQSDSDSYEDLELEYQNLLSSSSHQVQIGLLVYSMLRQSTSARSKHAPCVDALTSLNNNISLNEKVEAAGKEFAWCPLLESSTELDCREQDAVSFLRHLGTHYYGNYNTLALLSVPNANPPDSAPVLLLSMVAPGRLLTWWQYLKRDMESTGVHVGHIAKAWMAAVVLICLAGGGLFYTLMCE